MALSISLNAASQVNQLSIVSGSPVIAKEYISHRAREAYIASLCMLDCVFFFSQAAQYPHPDKDSARALNRTITLCKNSNAQGLSFVPLEMDTHHVAVFIDASVAFNPDYSSQLGISIGLMDIRNRANIIHTSMVKFKRIALSILAQISTRLNGIQSGIYLQDADATRLQLRHFFFLKSCIDSKCLFDAFTS